MTGVTLLVGIGFITNVFCSPLDSFGFFLEPDFFFGDFLSEDLKLPRRGNFTIQDGGTMIFDWVPEVSHKKNCQNNIFPAHFARIELNSRRQTLFDETV